VTRKGLRELLWGRTVNVDLDDGLHRCIKQIRTVLGDDPRKPIYIETVPRRGYRFIVPVKKEGSDTQAPESLSLV